MKNIESSQAGLRHILFICLQVTFASTSICAQIHDLSLIKTFKGHLGDVHSVAFSPNGLYAVSGSSDKTIILWEVESGKLVRRFEGHKEAVSRVVFSPNGLNVLSASHDQTLRLWDITFGSEVWSLDGYAKALYSVAISPNGRYAIFGSYGNPLRIWDMAEDKLKLTFQDFPHEVTSFVSDICFSPNGRFALSGGGGPSYILWDVAGGHWGMMGGSDTHSRLIWAVAFSPDSRHILAGSDDYTISLSGLVGGVIQTFEGHLGPIRSVSFSPDGRFVLSGSWDKTARLWEVDSGRLLHTFQGHEAQVLSVAFSPDGRNALSGSVDKTLKLWDVSPWTNPSVSIPTIAVLDLQGVGVSGQHTQLFTSRLSTILASSPAYRLIERATLQQILNEQDLQLTGSTSDEVVARIGQLLGAQQMLTGIVGRIASTYNIDLRIIDVETGGILRTTTFSFEGSINDLLTNGSYEIARQIIHGD